MPKSIRSQRHQRLLDILIEARRGAGLTQVAVAERLDRPQSYVAKIENGERRLDVVEFIELASALGQAPADLFGRCLQD